MEERPAAERARREYEAEPEEAERIRVTDRRRININDSPDSGRSGGDDQRAGGAAAGASSGSLKPTYVEELEARTRASEQKAQDVQSRFEQLRAEMRREIDETRQRLNRVADERAARAKAEFIAALLPVMDNLQRALEAAESGGSMEALLDGLHGTISGFENALTAAGVEPVVALNSQFNPEIHEAVDTVEVEAERDGAVTTEYSRGYTMGGQLLRPSRVQVGRAGRRQ